MKKLKSIAPRNEGPRGGSSSVRPTSRSGSESSLWGRRQNGGALLVGLLAMSFIGLGVVASASFRGHTLKRRAERFQDDVHARYLAASARELAVEMVRQGAPDRWTAFSLGEGEGRVLISDEREAGTRHVLAFGQAGDSRTLLFFSTRTHAGPTTGSPKSDDSVRVERLRNFTFTGVLVPDTHPSDMERGAIFDECFKLRSHLDAKELLRSQS